MNKAFSLLELLVVLMIVMIITTMVSFPVSRLWNRYQLQSAAEHLVTVLSKYRMAAILKNYNYQIQIQDNTLRFRRKKDQNQKWSDIPWESNIIHLLPDINYVANRNISFTAKGFGSSTSIYLTKLQYQIQITVPLNGIIDIKNIKTINE